MNEFSNIGLQLWYINSETGEEVLYSGETIYITDNTPLKFRVETKGSLYFIPDSSKFCFRDDPSTYLGLEGKYISLSVDAAKENILEGSSFSKRIVLNIGCQVHVIIISIFLVILHIIF